MTVLAVRGGAWLGQAGPSRGDVVVEDGRIAALGDAPAAVPGVDATALLVAPGYVDLQVNGGFGHDFTSEPASMWAVGAHLAAHGVTAFLPTIISAPPGAVDAALAAYAAGPPAGYAGAVPLGLHVEGPMLSPAYRGTHLVKHLAAPSLPRVAGWTREKGVRMVTLAPELPGALDVVRALASAGVVVAAGHSAATYDEAVAAFASGVTAVTHLFNGMAPLLHRAPGLAGAALARPDVVAGLIVDGCHVHPSVVDIAWRTSGPAGIALVTDAMAAAGARPGAWRIGDVAVEVRDGEVRNSDGALAGSVLLQDEAVRNLVAFARCAPGDAIAAAATTPAGLLGETERGTITVGARADLVLLDERLRVVATMVGGDVVFDRRAAATTESDLRKNA